MIANFLEGLDVGLRAAIPGVVVYYVFRLTAALLWSNLAPPEDRPARTEDE